MQFTKTALSASSNGQSILITATESPGTQIHTATATNNSTTWDEIYIYAYNSATSSIPITIQFGGTQSVNNDTKQSINSQAGRQKIIDGRVLNNGLTVYAYAASASYLTVDGYVHQIIYP